MFADMCEQVSLHVGPAVPDAEAVAASGGRECLVVGGRGIDVRRWPLPRGMCLDGRELVNAEGAAAAGAPHPARPSQGGAPSDRVLMAYSAADSFKRCASLRAMVFCGASMPAWLEERGLAPADLWSAAELRDEAEGRGIELWDAALYPACAEAEAGPPAAPRPASSLGSRFIAGYWCADARAAAPDAGGPAGAELGAGWWREAFLGTPRLSLAQANARSSPLARDELRRRLRCLAL